MKKAAILSVIIACVSVFAVCSVLVYDYFDKPDTDDFSDSIMSAPPTGDYWGSRLSQLLAEEAQKSTKAPSTTEKPTTTSTSKRTWFTAYEDSTTTAPRKTETTTKTAAVTTEARKTTRTATQAELKMLYDMAYNKVMADYYHFEVELLKQRTYITDIEANIDDLKDQASDLSADYARDKNVLNERYAAMGLLNSGAHKSALRTLEQEYNAVVAAIYEEIDNLQKDLTQAKEDCTQLENLQETLQKGQLEALIQAEYFAAVEEFQQKTLS